MKISLGLRIASATFAFIALAVVATPSATADTMSVDVVPVGYTLNLNELSSTSLTYAYNGSSTFSILNTGTDAWTVTTTSGSIVFNSFTSDWTEPENPIEVNEVTNNVAIGGPSNLYVTSDESLMEYQGLISTIVPDGTPVLVGSEGGIPVFLRFNDMAQTAESGTGVPDKGSSLGLLALSLAGFAGLRRFRRPQLA